MRSTALRILVVSVAASALVGITILLAGEVGELEGKILLTCLCVSAASILATACMPAWERRRLMPVPPVALASSLIGLTLYAAFLWAKPDADAPWRLASTFVVLGVAGAHASYLATAALAPRHEALRLSAHATGAFVAALFLALLLGADDEVLWRVLGAASILLTALTTLVVVFSRLAPGPPWRPAVEVRHCPACGAGLPDPGAASCVACGAAFRVTFEPR